AEEAIDELAARRARRLGDGAVGAAVGKLAVVLLPDPQGPGRRRALEAALAGERAALGPGGACGGAGGGARRAAPPAARPAPPPPGPPSSSPSGQSLLIVAADPLPALLLASEPALA